MGPAPKGTLRSQRPSFFGSSDARTNGGGLPYCPAALQQCRPRGATGPSRGAGGHTVTTYNSLDETYALPTEEAVTIALRTQQIIAEESGVASTIDPLGGSYYVEWLTQELETQALEYIRRIDELGGMVRAVETGFPQREIAASAYRYQRQLEDGEKIIVGVNKYTHDEEDRIPTLRIDEAVQREQIEALRGVKQDRDNHVVRQSLEAVRNAALGDRNLVPPIIDAAKALCTEQEICDVLRDVFGEYTERPEV